MSGSDVCRCGHDRAAHEHYRRGSDCGACGRDVCAAYRVAKVHHLRERFAAITEALAEKLHLSDAVER